MVDRDSWLNEDISEEELQKRHSEIGQYRSGSGSRRGYIKQEWPIWGPAEGDNNIRIVKPFEFKEIGYYGFKVEIHRNVGPNNDLFVCNGVMLKQPCYICQERSKVDYATEPDQWKALGTDLRVLIWIIDLKLREDDERFGLPQIWPAAKGTADEILAQSTDRTTGRFIHLENPVTGPSVWFDRMGRGLQTRYKNVQLGRDPIPLDPGVLEFMTEFPEVLIFPTYDEVKASYLGDYSSYPEANGSVSNGYGTQRSADVDLPPCFGKDYGKYAECDSVCAHIASCRPEGKALVEEPRKPSRPAATSAGGDRPALGPRPREEERPSAGDKPSAPPVERVPREGLPTEQDNSLKAKLSRKIAERKAQRELGKSQQK